MDNNIIHLYKISPKSEIFCQYYVRTINGVYAAFKAKMSTIKYIDGLEYENLNDRQRRCLSKCATAELKKPDVKERISEIARIEAEKNTQASLNEILEYYSLCLRKSKNNIIEGYLDTNLMFAGIKAAEQLQKRYDSGVELDDKIIFNRGVK